MTFNYNDKVIVNNPKLKTYKAIGCISSAGLYGSYVHFENGQTLYYNNDNLRPYKENQEDEKMTITGDFSVAKVKFLSGNNTNTTYEYAMFEPYEVGDTVVVSSANHGLGIAKIVAIITKEQATTKNFAREIVCKVDMETYETRKKNRARIHELSNRMDTRFKELNKIALFEMMAEKDDELKSMLEEYKNLVSA